MPIFRSNQLPTKRRTAPISSLPMKGRTPVHVRISKEDLSRLKKLKRQYPPKRLSRYVNNSSLITPVSHPLGHGIGNNATYFGGTGLSTMVGGSGLIGTSGVGGSGGALTVGGNPTSLLSSTTSSVNVYSSSTSSNFIVSNGSVWVAGDSINGQVDNSLDWRNLAGQEIKLPDGTIIKIDGSGNYVVEDKDAKILRRGSNIREFNRFINASDQLEAFIRDLGLVGVTQGKVLQIPIEVFINWLVLKAAEADQMPIPDGVQKLDYNQTVKEFCTRGRCLCCGRFLSQTLLDKKINFCSGEHLERYLQKQN